VPAYDDPRISAYRQEDAPQNNIFADVNENRDSASDLQWKYEKDVARRLVRTTPEVSITAPHITCRERNWLIWKFLIFGRLKNNHFERK
jgi:hypothetical protein